MLHMKFNVYKFVYGRTDGRRTLSDHNSSPRAIAQLEQKILDQESQIANMENRNYYSLHCLQMETQLIHANLDIVYEVLEATATVQSQSHSESSSLKLVIYVAWLQSCVLLFQLGKVWEAIGPIISAIQQESMGSPRNSLSPINNNNRITV
ncbi:hypothetical protein DPMN_036184 [Dreissena polymorpha]|uniref:Uncharacterized protein n=1 Tax=Dreissena polymorpha TaxID=45954 RepID=A0A9D4M8Z5_DREPO|nr:hypothetical protein DPMN_036184 [Dreissena polymorpha]